MASKRTTKIAVKKGCTKEAVLMETLRQLNRDNRYLKVKLKIARVALTQIKDTMKGDEDICWKLAEDALEATKE